MPTSKPSINCKVVMPVCAGGSSSVLILEPIVRESRAKTKSKKSA